MSGRTVADTPSGSGERPAATLPLPNGLAYVIAGWEVLVVAVLPFAVIAGGESLADAWAKFDLHNLAMPAVLGALIVWRRPGHVIGWVLVAAAGFDSLVIFGADYRHFRPDGFAGLPSGNAVWDALNFAWVLAAICLLVLLPQLFPDGRLLSRRWRPLFVVAVAAPLPLATLFVLDPRQLELESSFAKAFPGLGLAIALSLVPMAVRFRRSRGVERQQFKWVFYGLAISGPLCALGFILYAGGRGVSPAMTFAPLVVIPVVIAVAVLRFRLYDIDVVISKTLLVAGLAGFITVTYVAVVVGLGSLVGRGDEPNLVLSIAATTLVAVAFQPVRRRLQRVANRLVFGRRSTPYDVLSGFATRVGAGESSPESLVHLAELLAGGTGASPARVWLRVGSQLRAEATWPGGSETVDPVAIDTAGDLDAALTGLPKADLAVPVSEHGELLGVLTVAKPRGERVTEVDVDLVERLAATSGVVMRNVRLDAELTQRLEDLEASRRRLVTAQDDARRRIEAELAGGTRAELDLLRERLTMLSGVDAEAAPKTALLLEQLVAATDGATQTLAGLAAGVYPPRLAEEGLVVALTEQATKAAMPVQVHADGVGRYPAEVEAAVYFAVLEGLQNVAKYADATSAQVRLTESDGSLSFAVSDDGAGFDTTTTTLGTGLQGITDRLDTVHGTLTVESTPGTGTTITGRIPTTPTAAEVSKPVGVLV